MHKYKKWQAGQLQFDFSSSPTVEDVPIVYDLAWQDVTEIAHSAGFPGTCLVSTDLYEQLDDQALYDAIWTANFNLSLNEGPVAQFTLELDKKCAHFKAIQTNRAVRLGRANDF